MNVAEKGYFIHEESENSGIKNAKEFFADIAERILEYNDAFDLEQHKTAGEYGRCLCCMDERVGTGLHAAGSGILLPEEDFFKLCKEAGIDSLSDHVGCGAVAIFAGSEAGIKFARERGIDINDTDLIGKTWSMEMAEKLTEKLKRKIDYTHLEPKEHDHSSARVCYYDKTGRFNNTNGLPKGFVVGRKYMSKDASLSEVGVAKNIMWGDHGVGPDFFTKENPFLLVAIGESSKEVEKLKKELASLALGETVLVTGFVAPKTERKEKRRPLAKVS